MSTKKPINREFKKVIISPLGELTEDKRIVGDKVRYRIYYPQDTRIHADLTIIDKLDEGLGHINVFNGGIYDSITHSIKWSIKGSIKKRKAYVEFEAIVGQGTIKNQASFKALGLKPIKSNIVTIIVVERPAIGWIPFGDGGSKGEMPRTCMKDETTMGLLVNFDIDGMLVHEASIDGITFHRFTIPGQGNMMKVGDPELPIVGKLIEVPHDVTLKPWIFKSKSIILEDYNAYPAQEPIPRKTRLKKKFAINPATYLADKSFPGELVTITAEDMGIIRGHRVVFLKVNPIQYNPTTRKLEAFSNIEVRLEYDHPAQIEVVPKRIRSDAFEAVLRASVLNYKDPARFGRDNGQPPEERVGCDYLILTHGNFYNASDANNPVVRLQNWKQRMGYTTKVVDIANIKDGDTADGIKAYLQNAYDYWYPVPTYVLLVGDVTYIPTNYKTPHSLHNNTLIGTDLYYAALDGNDYFPDLYIGRISIEDLAQAGDVVDKILRYEQNPPATPAHADYYQDTSLVCLFEDVTWTATTTVPPDGTENPTFRIIEFAEAIRGYLVGQGYNVQRIYSRSGNYINGPQKYEDGANIPNELTINPPAPTPPFAWSGATADIEAAINAGNFLVTYDGHGSPSRWAQPTFGTVDFTTLTNNDLFPVVFSFACMTGWFDHETDDASITTATDDCFCEKLLRQANSGASAVIGSTRKSWENNDFMMLGVYKALWPEFEPVPPSSRDPPHMVSSPMTQVGQVLVFSEIYMANVYGDDFNRKSSFEMYHVFGDPATAIWTRAPSLLKAEYPEGIGSTGTQDFIVKVLDDQTGNPIQDATVVLTRRETIGGNPIDRIIRFAQADPYGNARFTLDNVGSGDIDVTITAHNYRPYMKIMKAIAGGAVLNRLQDNNGVEGQTIHVGGQGFSGNENVDIYFGGDLITTATAQGGSFGQPGSDFDITVPSPHIHGPVNILAKGQTSGLYAVDVFNVRSENPVDLWIYDQWDPSTWASYPGSHPTWDNPDIQLYDQNNNPVGSANLIVGNNYNVKMSFHNDTAFNAPQADVVLRWADFGMGSPWNHVGDAKLDVPPGGAVAEIPFVPPITGHLCINAEIHHLEDINPNNNMAQENLHVGGTSSPAKVCFVLHNPTDVPSPIFMEVRQLFKKGQNKERLWATWIKHPDPQEVEPRGHTKACVIVDPDIADAKVGTMAEFAVTAFIGSKMIGGINLKITKQPPV